jgi:pimeloyl-ACP methyl ester carboxylesterase
MFRTDDGVSLAYVVQGEGIPLVLVNGLPDTMQGWSGAAEVLAPYFRVIRYDLRNQGLVESGGDDDYLVDRHILDLVQLLQHLGIGPFVGVGISLGARILADFAGAHRDRPLRLILVGASNRRLAPSYRAIFGSWLRALQFSPPDSLLPFVECFATWALPPAVFARDPDFFAQYARLLAATQTRHGLGANIRAMINSYDPAYLAKQPAEPIPTRTLFVQGEADFLTPPGFIREMVELFPRSSLSVIPGCGHNVRVGDPRRLEQEIVDFLVNDDELMEGGYEH